MEEEEEEEEGAEKELQEETEDDNGEEEVYNAEGVRVEKEEGKGKDKKKLNNAEKNAVKQVLFLSLRRLFEVKTPARKTRQAQTRPPKGEAKAMEKLKKKYPGVIFVK